MCLLECKVYCCGYIIGYELFDMFWVLGFVGDERKGGEELECYRILWSWIFIF